MKRNNRIILLLVLAMLLLFFAGRETYHLFHDMSHLSPPTAATREPFGPHIHGWMTAEEVADFYNVSTAELFAAMNIDPAPGDEKLTLKDLIDKYNKTGPEIQDDLNKLNRTDDPSRGKDQHG